MAKGYGPLSGVTVIDLTQFLSGPFATMIMADMGADVIKVERPDRPKASGPYLNGERTYDLSIMRSKRSVTLNLKEELDKKVLLKMVEKADVIIENFKPGTMERMGLGYDVIKEVNPKIIYMAISGFGYTGPYKDRGALDMVIQGMSGLMSLTGDPKGGATRCGTSVSDIFTGIYSFGAVSAALYDREKTGKGQFNAVINTCVLGKNPERVGNTHPVNAPFGTFPAKDGEIIITCSRNSAFENLCHAIHREDMLDDPRFNDPDARRLHREELTEELSKFTREHTIDENEAILAAGGVPYGRINTMQMICADPQIAARHMLVEVDHKVAGKYKMPGSPIKMATYPDTTYEPAPMLGENNREVFRDYAGMTDEEIDALLKEQEEFLKAKKSK